MPPNCHSLHCYAKEKEKCTFEDKMVLLFKQSRYLYNSSLNGRVHLEPGTCCLQKHHIMGSDVKGGKWAEGSRHGESSEIGNREHVFAKMRGCCFPASRSIEPCFCKARGMGFVNVVRGLA